MRTSNDRSHNTFISLAPTMVTSSLSAKGERTIRLAIAGVGNCANALLQLLALSRTPPSAFHCYASFDTVSDATVSDIDPVVAFDIDERKVNMSLARAAFCPPNCVPRYSTFPSEWFSVPVLMGENVDAIASSQSELAVHPAALSPSDMVKELTARQVDVLVNLLPTGSVNATRHLARVALEARVAFVNAIPIPVANETALAREFYLAGIPVIGDDLRSQFGSTALTQTVINGLLARGVRVTDCEQWNVGGNSDFFNLQQNWVFKERTKLASIENCFDVSPQPDNLVLHPCEFQIERRDFKKTRLILGGVIAGGRHVSVEVNLEVEDSPDAAGVLVDLIRVAAAARMKGDGGVLYDACAYGMKRPPRPIKDDAALLALERLYAAHAPRRWPQTPSNGSDRNAMDATELERDAQA